MVSKRVQSCTVRSEIRFPNYQKNPAVSNEINLFRIKTIYLIQKFIWESKVYSNQIALYQKTFSNRNRKKKPETILPGKVYLNRNRKNPQNYIVFLVFPRKKNFPESKRFIWVKKLFNPIGPISNINFPRIKEVYLQSKSFCCFKCNAIYLQFIKYLITQFFRIKGHLR